jgi:Rps23 Pro-64 3,4-dihydroxylase Tpa1-like proline 4-hydroxylase
VYAGWEDPQLGGQLRLYPGTAQEQLLAPTMDRLVLFWSDSVEHAVEPTAAHAPPRLALSFWYHEAGDSGGGGEAQAADVPFSPLLQARMETQP